MAKEIQESSGNQGSPARDYELLGDLQMKQGKPAEALGRYQIAIKQKASAGLYRKMAQALLALGRDAEARQALDMVQKYAGKPSSQRGTTGSKQTASLPSKLIVSAPKKLLDQVHAGKITFDELKKNANVHYLTFRAKE
jgi:hypothetical protein